jgi:hypothetical protein
MPFGHANYHVQQLMEALDAKLKASSPRASGEPLRARRQLPVNHLRTERVFGISRRHRRESEGWILMKKNP